MKALLFATALLSLNAEAWGPTGHRVTGEIAEQQLTPQVRSRVAEILDNTSLARATTWADEIRSEPETYGHTVNWHFTDWPDHAHDHDETASSGKLMTAIAEQLAVLRDKEAPKDKKAFALRFVAHLVGDLHMPLHVGNGLDRGGNNCRVTFHGRNVNLHALWDDDMIEFTKLSFTELTRFIMEGKTAKEIGAAQRGTPLDWARESKEIRSTLYPENVIGKTERPEPNMSVRTYCLRDARPDELPRLGFEYSYRFMPVVERRLFEAGIRLGQLLNDNLK